MYFFRSQIDPYRENDWLVQCSHWELAQARTFNQNLDLNLKDKKSSKNISWDELKKQNQKASLIASISHVIFSISETFPFLLLPLSLEGF